MTVDVASLCLKSGNACLLRGSTSARATNAALLRCVRDGLKAAGLPEDAVVPLEASREELAALVADPAACDVVIPRGGEALKKFLLEHARVPVLVAAGGNCHVYLHADADPAKALPIVINAKTQRPGVCNACETLLVHRDALPLLGPIGAELAEHGVELRADAEAAEALGAASLAADEDDWATEFLDLVLAVRTVGSVEEAIEHIERYSTGHSEAIVTESIAAADAFVLGISSACVYVNASTRFTDGGEFGFGAEIGNSTARLHARGPGRPGRHHDDEVRRARRGPGPRLTAVAAQDDAAVVAAEAHRVREGVLQLHVARALGHVVEVALGVGIAVVERGGHDLVTQREGADGHLERAGAAELVAGGRLRRRDHELAARGRRRPP